MDDDECQDEKLDFTSSNEAENWRANSELKIVIDRYVIFFTFGV